MSLSPSPSLAHTYMERTKSKLKSCLFFGAEIAIQKVTEMLLLTTLFEPSPNYRQKCCLQKFNFISILHDRLFFSENSLNSHLWSLRFKSSHSLPLQRLVCRKATTVTTTTTTDKEVNRASSKSRRRAVTGRDELSLTQRRWVGVGIL